MSSKKHTAIVVIVLLAVIPFSAVVAFLVFFMTNMHERLIEKRIEAILGLEVTVTDVDTIHIDHFRIGKITVGRTLLKADNISVTCSLRPFRLNTVTLGTVEVDITGANTVKLFRMIENVKSQFAETRSENPFSMNIEKAFITVPFLLGGKGGRTEIALHSLGLNSTHGTELDFNAKGLEIDKKEYYCILQGTYNGKEQNGSVAFEGDTSIGNLFIGDTVQLQKSTVSGNVTFDLMPEREVVCRIAVFDLTNKNRLKAQVRIGKDLKSVYIDAFETNLSKALQSVKHPFSEYVSLSDEGIVGSLTMHVLDDKPGFSLSYCMNIEKMAIEFIKDVVFDDYRYHFSRLKPYEADTLTLEGSFSLVLSESADSYNEWNINRGRGSINNGEIFGEVSGRITFLDDFMASDINVDIYQVPLESARIIFTIYDASDSWVTRFKGPVDISVAHFDINRPAAAPLVFNSGSEGLDFWISNSLPRIDGIFFDDMKLYLLSNEGSP